MSKATSVRVDNDHEAALGKMVDRGEADNPSEALRQTSQAELARRGYLDNSHATSYWAWALQRIAMAFMYVGAGAVAVLYFLPVRFRLVAVVPLLAGLVCLVGSRALAMHHDGGRVRRPLKRGSGQ